jgi:hypothetical protein
MEESAHREQFKLNRGELLFVDVPNLQFCLVAGIPTLAAVFGILVDRIHYKSLMVRFDQLDALFGGFETKFDRHR